MNWEEMLEVLEELVSDVRCVGPREVKKDWPDLYVTYQHAKDAIRKAKKLEGTVP